MTEAERQLPEQPRQPEHVVKLGGLSIGDYKPEKFITNDEFEQWRIETKGGNLLKASDIKKVTGIDRRYRAGPNESVIYMGIKAALAAKDLKDIYAVFASTSYPIGKNVSHRIGYHLELHPKRNLDIHAACSGFVLGLTYMKEHEKEFRGKKILFVATEEYSPTLADLRNGGAKIDSSMAQTIFSDGAAAMVFTFGEDIHVLGFENRTIKLSETFENCIRMPIKESLMREPFISIPIPHPVASERFEQDGRSVIRGLMDVPNLNLAVLKNAGLQASDVKLVIPHQSSPHMIELLKEHMPRHTIMEDLQDGNFSSASILKALARAIKEGQIQRGDQILLSAFGAGKDLFESSAVVRLR